MDRRSDYDRPILERKSVKQRIRERAIDLSKFMNQDWNAHRKQILRSFDRVTRGHLSILVIWGYYSLGLSDFSDGFWDFYSILLIGISMLIACFVIPITLHFLYLTIYKFLILGICQRYPQYKFNLEESENTVGFAVSVWEDVDLDTNLSIDACYDNENEEENDKVRIDMLQQTSAKDRNIQSRQRPSWREANEEFEKVLNKTRQELEREEGILNTLTRTTSEDEFQETIEPLVEVAVSDDE
jgi:hypothetical protein